MSEIWRQCKGERHVRPLQGRLVRLVESQEQVATLQLVDTLEEQALLEELLESSKPPVPADAEPLHYLLKTPFRYPPLRWGSRFGRRHEPSLFYAALKLETAMAESAYYRCVLWSGMAVPPPSGRILSEHASFEAGWKVERGIRLQAPPFSDHEAALTDIADYRAPQELGSAMRSAGVQAFE
ncbi:RES family NAD+ phosphorylase, partial [Pseudomonas aeruginosa]